MNTLYRYQSHKQVSAGKILSIVTGSQFTGTAGKAQLTLEGNPATGWAHGKTWRTVSQAWMTRHAPKVGGYFVEYDGGYTSYSPAEAFESGYATISDDAEPTPTAQDSSYRAESCSESNESADFIKLEKRVMNYVDQLRRADWDCGADVMKAALEELRRQRATIADQKAQIHRGIEREQALKAQLDAVRQCNDTLQDTVDTLQSNMSDVLRERDDKDAQLLTARNEARLRLAQLDVCRRAALGEMDNPDALEDRLRTPALEYVLALRASLEDADDVAEQPDDAPTAEEEEAFDALQSLQRTTPIPAAELSGEFVPPTEAPRWVGVDMAAPEPELDDRLAAVERRLNANISEAFANLARRLTALEDDGE